MKFLISTIVIIENFKHVEKEKEKAESQKKEKLEFSSMI